MRMLPILLLLATLAAAADDAPAPREPLEVSAWHWTGVERVVVVPDVHGAYDRLVALLRQTGVVDESLAWSGGATHLVSLGDLLDRGGDSRAVMDLLMRLQEEAPGDGGAVHVVLGNHEHMNLVGDLRYVADGEFAAFAGEESAAMRELVREEFMTEHPEMSAEERMAAFANRYPPGYFAHRAAFRPDGRYGRWLLTLPVVLVIDGTAFVHGGLPARTADWTADQLNRTFSRDLRRYLEVWRDLVDAGALRDDEPLTADAVVTDAIVEDPSRCVEERALACEKIEGNGEVIALLEDFNRLSDAPVNGYDSPFWYRGSVYCRDILERPVLEDALATLDARRVVVGHTPTSDRRVRAIRDGQVIMTDTGMLVSYYNGHPAALVIQDGELRVHYQDEDDPQRPLPGFGPTAWGLEADEFATALREGRITAVDRETDAGAWRVTLVRGVTEFRARFYPDGDGAREELAARALDRLLGTELVAPTVRREVDGRDGALQLAFPEEVSERERAEGGLRFGGWCSIRDQLQLMYAFDLVIGNRQRSADDILFDRRDWTLRLTRHRGAFGRDDNLPRGLREDAIALPAGLAAALRRLDEDSLTGALDDYLDGKRIAALLERRDEVLRRFAPAAD